MKVIVLTSGGLDSATCLAKAIKMYGADEVVALNTYYGQKHDKEIECASKLADYYKVGYLKMDLAQVMKYSDCTLLKGNGDIEEKPYETQIQEHGTVSTYVPFRNGVLLSVAAAIALSVGASEVWYGAHKDDAAGDVYPDCSAEFAAYMNDAIYEGSGKRVVLYAPFINKDKAGVVKEGLELGVPYEMTWSCYEGGEKPCGKCGTCIDRARAFKANGIEDPLYG